MRAGKVTASELDALISPLGKIRESKGVDTYLARKLVERWTGAPLPQLQGVFDVEQGEILERKAKPAFTIHTGLEIESVGFIETDDGTAGCSPDGLIGETSGVEIKCPTMAVHIGYLLAGKLPQDYVAQVQGSMFVTGYESWHFFSYSRHLPPLHLIVERDEKFQCALGAAIADFSEALNESMNRLIELNGEPPPKRAPMVFSVDIAKDEFFDHRA